MSWVAVAVIGGSVVTAGVGAASARSAARAGQRGADAASAEQARQYDLTRADFAPQRELGQGAVGMLGRLYGIPIRTEAQRTAEQDVLMGDTYLPAGTYSDSPSNPRGSNIFFGDRQIGRVVPGGANGRFIAEPGVDINGLALQREQQAGAGAGAPTAGPDMSVFFESPDYQFNLTEGQKAIDRSLAARGRTLSGAGVREGVRYASGMASNEYGNFYNRLANLAGLGQSATQSTAAAGANAANNISQNHLFAANARANGYMQAGQAANNAVQGGIQNYMLYQYLNKPATTPTG